jgi:hypothetical protein
MTSWHGYILLELTVVLTPAQRARLIDVWNDFRDGTDTLPDRIGGIRLALANNKAIIECNFPGGLPTKAQAVTVIANRFGVSQATINGMLTFTAFAGADHDARAAAARAYLAANSALWQAPL